MSRYETPRVPPATPPVVNEDAHPRDTLDKAQVDGDSSEDGSRFDDPDRDMSQIATEREGTPAEHKRRDGMGEASLDKLPPD